MERPPLLSLPLMAHAIPLAQLPTLMLPPSHVCNDCYAPFIRKEQHKGSSAYFRCGDCQSHMLQHAIVGSCTIH